MRMPRVVLALLVLATVALAGVGIGTATPSYAASGSGCSVFSAHRLSQATQGRLKRLTQHVGAVFEGSVRLPAKADAHKPITVTVHVLAAWKGASATSTAKVVLEPGACRAWTLAHRSPEDYLFLASRDRTTGGFTVSGDAPRVLAHTSAIEKVLGTPLPGGDQSGQRESAVSFRRVGSSVPRSFGRLAAPGAAIAIIGLLGLLVVGRLARRA